MNSRQAQLAGMMLVLVAGAPGVLAQEAPRYVWKDGGWQEVAPAEPGTPAGDLAAVRALQARGEHGDVVDAAEAFCKAHPDSPLREEALNLAGQAEFDRGRYYQAYERYERQITEFPNGKLLDRALAREVAIAEKFLAGEKRIALKVLRLPAQDEALDILLGVAEHAPGSQRAQQALLRIADYHFQQEDWSRAAEAYDHFLATYPKSDRAAYAMLQAAHAAYRAYEGPAFDETPLIEAEQRYRTVLAEHEQAARREGVEGILEQITALRAEKLYETARFYERVDKPKAARYAYAELARQYPQTDWGRRGQEAAERLAPSAPQRSDEAGGPEPPAKPDGEDGARE